MTEQQQQKAEHLELFENKTERELVYWDYKTKIILFTEILEYLKICDDKNIDYDFELFKNDNDKEEIHLDDWGYCYCSRCEKIVYVE